ncbi:MAG: FAD binding domain-containing protein [Bryobacteraceae bacterium]
MFESVEAFYRPANVREALHLLQRRKGSARIVAGCTDVIVEEDHAIRFLIDITHAGLSYIRAPEPSRAPHRAHWAIGATTTMAQLEESAEIRALAGGLLSRAAATCGSVEIRNMATVGGNMANGSPAADLATPLLALDATAVVAGYPLGSHLGPGPSGRAQGTPRRNMPLADYLAVARSREMAQSLLVELTFADPPNGSHCGWSFQKFGRTAVDISVVNVAAGLQLDHRGRVQWVRIALGAVAPTPVRMAEAEALMAGRTLDHALIAEASESAMRGVRPIGDQRASAEYRQELSRVLTGRALQECAECAAPKGCFI